MTRMNGIPERERLVQITEIKENDIWNLIFKLIIWWGKKVYILLQ